MRADTSACRPTAPQPRNAGQIQLPQQLATACILYIRLVQLCMSRFECITGSKDRDRRANDFPVLRIFPQFVGQAIDRCQPDWRATRELSPFAERKTSLTIWQSQTATFSSWPRARWSSTGCGCKTRRVCGTREEPGRCGHRPRGSAGSCQHRRCGCRSGSPDAGS